MSYSLFELLAPNFQQTIAAAKGVLEKSAAWAAENGVDAADLAQARLREDMQPLGFQVHSITHHSLNALKGVEAGAFSPPSGAMPETLPAMSAALDDTLKQLGEWDAARINALAAKDMKFKLGDREIPFVGFDFLMSFSLPNFYFHATTAYDILRHKGVPLSKRDYLGQLRIKQP